MDAFDDEWAESDPDPANAESEPWANATATPAATSGDAADGGNQPAANQSEPAAASTPAAEAAAKPEPAKPESKVTGSPSARPEPTVKTSESATPETKSADQPSDARATKSKAETKSADQPSDAAATKPKAEAKPADRKNDAGATKPKAKSKTETAKATKTSDPKGDQPSEPPSAGPDSLDRELSMLSPPPASVQEAKPARSEWPGVQAEPIQLGDALMLDVLFGRWPTSLRTVFLTSIALSAVLVGLAVFAVVRSAEKASSTERPVNTETAAAASARAALSASGSPAASAQPAAQDLLALASTGNVKAMEALDAKPTTARSAAEAAALVRGREVRRQGELKKLGEELLLQPQLEHDHHAWRTLHEFVRDPRTATDALAIIAKLPGPAGADLLYKVWTETRERTDASGLAQELVCGPDVRPKASQALSVALALRNAKECEEYKVLLPRAIEHGDRRSLRLLGRLLKKRGCGRKNLEDCYKCLREGKELTKAIQAVKRRDEPSFQPEPEPEPEPEAE